MVLTILVLAAQQATLTGVVRDSSGLEPVSFAEVRVSSIESANLTVTALSDRFGAFVVPNAPAGPVRVEANALGYAPWSRDYDELPAEPVTILLRPAPIPLDSLSVEAGGRRGDPLSFSRDAFVVDPAQIRALPAMLETDVLRAIARSPSASAPSDWVSVPLVRGGTSEGTPLLLDGVRLFNPFHLLGFVSAVNAEAVDHATLLPSSGAGAEHIGSLSGAIEIATRDGARDRHRVAAAVGLASSRLTVEGPVGDDASYLVNGRRTYIDLFTRALKGLGVIEDHFPYSFYDLHAKVTKDFGGVRRLSVTGYRNAEGVKYDNTDDGDLTRLDWGNAAVAAHYRDRLRTGAFLDATLGHSRFAGYFLDVFGLDRPPADTAWAGNSRMTENRAEARVTWHAGRNTVAVGGQVTRFEGDHDYGYEYEHETGIRLVAPLALRAVQWRTGIFANVARSLGGSWNTRAGMRADHFPGLGGALSPFAELSYDGSWWTARVSAARSHQSVASLRNEESVGTSYLAYDVLAPVERGPVPRNTEISAGWDGRRGASRLRLDAYARRMDHLRLPPLVGDPFEEVLLGEPALRRLGSGTARGVEASWSWARGPVSTVGTYRWSQVTRTVEQLTYVPRFHRAHEIELGTALETRTSTWSARFSLRSGQPVTPLLAVVPAGTHAGRGNIVVVLGGAYNSGRLPRYVRLDLGWRRGGERVRSDGRLFAPFLSVINLFSAPNVVAGEIRFWGKGGDDRVEVERTYQPQMPVLAFFGLEFRF